jgi:DNA polymerase III epsilon subunit-like protein
MSVTESHYMVDLETLGQKPGCAIISIGAIRFDPYRVDDSYDEMTGQLYNRSFYRTIDMKSCVDIGLTLEPDTIKWWLTQKEKVRLEFAGDHPHIRTVLAEFSAWINTQVLEPTLWGNGATFDNVILEAAFQKAGMKFPFRYYNSLCYRTLTSLGLVNKKKEFTRYGVYHNALDDAASQAIFMQKIMSKIRSLPLFHDHE